MADATAEVGVAADGRFHLTITRTGPHQPVIRENLSLDPGDPRRADRVAYDEHRPSAPVTVELMPAQPVPDRDAPRRIRPGGYPCRPARVALAAQTGMITYPLAGLARLIRERPDTLPAELVQLAAATGDRCYAERAAAVASTLRGQLQPAGDAFAWPYWPSFGRVHLGWVKTGDIAGDGSRYRPQFRSVTRPEDVTHALIDIDFAVLYRTTPGLPEVFTETDMRALGHTFRRHVCVRRIGRRPTVRCDVSGRGGPGTPRHEAHVPGWFPLQRWNPAVARAVTAVQARRRSVPPMAVDTSCAALLARRR